MRAISALVLAASVSSLFACGSHDEDAVASAGMTAEAENKAGGHIVAGYAWNDYGYGNWSHTFDVVQAPNGQVFGFVKVDLFEPATPDYPGLDVEYTTDVECLEFDEETNSAWLGGRVTKTNFPDLLGVYVIDFARDGGPGGANDGHGDWVPSWYGGSDDCHDRLGPLFEDPAQKGNIVVK